MTIAFRPARSTDAGKIGAILHGFETGTSWMPKQHTGAEAIAFCGRMIDLGWVTVAYSDREVLGFVACDGSEICALYLAPQICGQGIGKALLDHVKAAHSRLSLRTFQANEGAQRFYLREGFVEQSRTDGQGNDEGLADIEYLWTREDVQAEKKAAASTTAGKASKSASTTPGKPADVSPAKPNDVGKTGARKP